jgi:hypothetical protein
MNTAEKCMDLRFSHFPAAPDAEVPMPEDFLITAISEKGVEWIGKHAADDLGDPDLATGNAAQANAWPKTKAEFHRLKAQAVNDGMKIDEAL